MQKKRLITAGGTLMCALGIGYFMQSGQAPSAPQTAVVTAGVTGGSAQPAPEAMTKDIQKPADQSVDLGDVTLTSAAPATSDVPVVPELPTQPVVQAALDDTPAEQTDTPEAEAEAEPDLACEYALTSKSEAAAMVRLTLSAPCMANERFTLHHNGMMISEVTDADGASELVVPALSENATFIVAFPNGEGAVANAQVTSLAYYDRAVLQWRGNGGMQIHALEFGADYGAEGHVSAKVARDQSVAALGQGGFITRHGASDLDEALVAEVYTFPTGVMKRDGDVALRVEAEVTAANCGRDVEAQSIQTGADGTLKTQDLVLAMPDCNAIGDFLVLNNLLNDLKIAAK
ncbi:hypothetical protein [Roseovarius sp. 2305UL8-3]|uniref:hypothetical protein n=1 Tax=Roseovarius conchicola TaxID=3121636 RepID=UPI003528C381